jgi:hypothetical protein
MWSSARKSDIRDARFIGTVCLSSFGPSEIESDSGRFSNHGCFTDIDPRERGKGYARSCEQLLNLNDVSLPTIQVCVLLGAIAVVDGRPASESIYYSIACRIAQLLDLPNRHASSRVEQEVNIRGLHHHA